MSNLLLLKKVVQERNLTSKESLAKLEFVMKIIQKEIVKDSVQKEIVKIIIQKEIVINYKEIVKELDLVKVTLASAMSAIPVLEIFVQVNY